MKKMKRINIALWVLVGLAYVFSILAGLSISDNIDKIMFMAVMFTGVAFTFVHAYTRYSWKEILIFLLSAVIWSMFFEALSINTGFPFGNYHYDASMGPQLLGAPIVIGLFYFFFVYSEWNIAHALLGKYDNKIKGSAAFSVPFISTLLFTALDMDFDPYFSTVLGKYIWHNGGAYFGVPFSNFCGWYLCTFMIFQSFALFIWYRSKNNKLQHMKTTAMSRQSFWLQSILIICAFPLQLLIKGFTVEPTTVIKSLDGITWNYSYLLQTAGIVSLGTTITFAVIALLRIFTVDKKKINDMTGIED